MVMLPVLPVTLHIIFYDPSSADHQLWVDWQRSSNNHKNQKKKKKKKKNNNNE
jgi:hypothetical protein